MAVVTVQKELSLTHLAHSLIIYLKLKLLKLASKNAGGVEKKCITTPRGLAILSYMD